MTWILGKWKKGGRWEENESEFTVLFTKFKQQALIALDFLSKLDEAI